MTETNSQCFNLQEVNNRYRFVLANNQYRLVLDAPNLELLEFNDCGARECNLDKLYSLVKATVNIHQGYYQSIRVSDGEYAQQALSKASCYNLPNFRNLTQLEVGVHRHGWSMLLLLSQILRCSPNLKVLLLKDYDPFFNGIIKNRYGNQKTDSVGGEAIFMEQSVPQCLVSFIERMEFTGFDTKSIKEHLRFIEYILTNATALKVLRITLSRASPEDELDILGKLIMLPRASSTCRLLISCNRD